MGTKRYRCLLRALSRFPARRGHRRPPALPQPVRFGGSIRTSDLTIESARRHRHCRHPIPTALESVFEDRISSGHRDDQQPFLSLRRLHTAGCRHSTAIRGETLNPDRTGLKKQSGFRSLRQRADRTGRPSGTVSGSDGTLPRHAGRLLNRD